MKKTMNTLVNISNLTVLYNKKPTAAVADFNLTVKKGEIVSIVGESGSGKTTVLKTIAGILPKNARVAADELAFSNKNLLGISKKEWAALRGRKIAMVFQDNQGALNPIRKIGEQFIEYIQFHSTLSKKQAYNKACELLKKMKLVDSQQIMDSYPHQISGGMCQRVGIALAMAFEPDLLIADEPTSALDASSQRKVVEELLFLREQFGTAIIIVTHHFPLGAYLADQLIVMQNGQIIDQGSVMDVLETPKSFYTKQLLASVPELGGISNDRMHS